MARDDLAGGLRDLRLQDGVSPADEVVEWLVSGNASPFDASPEERVRLAGTDAGKGNEVEVEKLPVADRSGNAVGHCAWWTGDLGVRANIATHDAGVTSPKGA